MIDSPRTRMPMNLQRATTISFGATFFFLPLSKPLTYACLLAAIVLSTVSGELRAALRERPFPAWAAPAAILAVLPLISLVVHDEGFHGRHYLALSYYWGFAFLAYAAARRFAITVWLRAFLAGVLVTFVYAQLKSLGWLALPNEPPAVGNYILYSQFLAVAVVVASLLYRDEQRGRVGAGYLVAAAALLYDLAIGQGRSGMIAVLVLAPFIAGNFLWRQPKWTVPLACVIGVAVLLSTPGVQRRIDDVRVDVEKLRQSQTQTSLGYRLDMWETAAIVFRENPLLGGGPDAFRQAWRQRFPTAYPFDEPHNAYATFAAAYGIAGLVAVIGLYGALAWTGWRQRRTLAGGLIFAFAVICILGSFTNTMFMGSASRLMMMLFIGLHGNVRYLATGRRAPAAAAGAASTATAASPRSSGRRPV
jgi:O-antigen ligase